MLRKKIAQIEQNRASSDPLPKTTAPYASSTFYKLKNVPDKPKAKRWDDRFSVDSRNQNISPLKLASRVFNHPDMISLGVARPSAEYFPWESMDLLCTDSSSPGAKSPLESGLRMGCAKGEDDYDLGIAMNYGYSSGSPHLLRYLTEHTELLHNPPYQDWETVLSCGTTSAMEIAFRIFTNPGDTVLMDGYMYSGTLTAAQSQGLNALGIEMDEQGIIPENLDHKLNTWNSKKGRKPFVLYTIPSGQNPTSTTQGFERRKEIYQLAEKHNLFILEDDPYFYFQMGKHTIDAPPADLDDYIKSLPVSYLSLDVSGRVLRMDTTSKILAPGLRCGWVTGSSQVIEKFICYSEVGVVCPSGPSQVMAYKLLDVKWGHEGFIRWLMNLSAEYRRRRDVLVAACEKHLPTEYCVWKVPEVGMFLWIDLDLSKSNPTINQVNGTEPWQKYLEIEGEIFNRAQENGVVVSKASWFIPDVKDLKQVSFRLTFAAAKEDALDKGMERFGQAVRSYFGKGQQNGKA
ncbi:hypothetical protein CDV36_002995 [Fusarium kuroshium]|uniref:Aminotransferase class I/classII large domain-containing protein n=1 Tax=Fusarium kuroshium TaxID=2010991 RepID=A0A3M2SIF7_9HYPO|nr:hypothetical protein CDV36_002995 [Fusarium kuroshium]